MSSGRVGRCSTAISRTGAACFPPCWIITGDRSSTVGAPQTSKQQPTQHRQGQPSLAQQRCDRKNTRVRTNRSNRRYGSARRAAHRHTVITPPDPTTPRPGLEPFRARERPNVPTCWRASHRSTQVPSSVLSEVLGVSITSAASPAWMGLRRELVEVIHQLRQECLGVIDDEDFPHVLAEVRAAVPGLASLPFLQPPSGGSPTASPQPLRRCAVPQMTKERESRRRRPHCRRARA